MRFRLYSDYYGYEYRCFRSFYRAAKYILKNSGYFCTYFDGDKQYKLEPLEVYTGKRRDETTGVFTLYEDGYSNKYRVTIREK